MTMDNSYGNAYSTSYGAQGGADGGGFMGGEVQSSPAGGKGYEKVTIRPLTIKQILEAQQPHPDAEFKVDGDVVTQITFVGQIRSLNTQHATISCRIDDGTGIVEVKHWKPPTDGDPDEMDISEAGKSNLVEDGYCRVWGRLKSFGNKRYVNAQVIRQVNDYNEVNYHLLEAAAIHLFFKHGPPPDHQTNGQARGGAQNNQGFGQTETTANGRSIPSHLSPKAKAVYKYLMDQPQSNEGMHVQLIASGLGMDVNEVYKAGEELVANSLTFSTVDDNTWAVLEY